MSTRRGTDHRRTHPLSRWLLLLAVGLLLLAVPASATDRYDDVAPGATHAESIRELADAGVVLGCAPGRYCPSDPVRRDQLASFLARSTPRTASDTSATVLSTANGYRGVPAAVTVRGTGASGGTGVVTLQGSVSVVSDGDLAGCPCEVEAFIYRASDQAQGPSGWTQLPGTAAGTGRASTSLAVTWQTEVPSATTESFRLAVFLNGVDGVGPTGVTAEGTLTAMTTALP